MDGTSVVTISLGKVLRFYNPLQEVEAVLDHGDQQPGRVPGDWVDPDRDHEEDYRAALRHLIRVAGGDNLAEALADPQDEGWDPKGERSAREQDSGRRHEAHAVSRLLIAMYHARVFCD